MPRFAAIDIGSNSIRMQVEEITPGKQSEIVASERQVTRLGESVFRSGRLSTEAIEFACKVLASMGQKCRAAGTAVMRAVGTSALRDASNKNEFITRASEVLGTNVEVISGLEEARLIYLGVQRRWPNPKGSRLIVDVGGGSAELIAGENGHFVEAYSKKVGAVRLKEVFLKSEPPDQLQRAQMEEYIEQRLESVVQRLATKSYDHVIATSGTAAALVCAINAVPRSMREKADRLCITRSGLKKFYGEIANMGLEARRKVAGIGPRRAEIIIPGAAVILHVAREFGVKRLCYSSAGLRDGVITDLEQSGAGRELTTLDPDRRVLVTRMARRYKIDLAHARKVADLSALLFECTETAHQLPPQYGKLLEAAALLFDIGHFVSDTRHHRHSAYLVANSDLPGFTSRERQIIANLCRYHRKALPAPSHEEFQVLDSEAKRAVSFLTPLLRLSAALDQRREQRVRTIRCLIRPDGLAVTLVSNSDVKLEQWAGEQVSPVFSQIFGRPLILSKERA